MANASLGHSSAHVNPSFPEKIAHWLFKTAGSWRNVLGFIVVSGLTIISICFNVQLAKLSAVDETSRALLPTGYALLDLSALFLSGFVGIRSKSYIRKLIAWGWFGFLLCLSLWAAAAFTLSVDYRQSVAPIQHQVEQKQHELKTQQATVAIWQDNVSNAVRYKTKHQKTLANEQDKERSIQSELSALEEQLTPPALIIYDKAAQFVGMTPPTLQLIVRLAWAFALVICPLLLVLLLAAELYGNAPASPTPNGGKRTRKLKEWLTRCKDKMHPHPHDNAPESVRPVVASNEPESVQDATPLKRTRKPRKDSTEGTRHDSGTLGKASNRYDELRKSVLSGRVRPSLRSVRNHCGCNQVVSQRYLDALAREGVITRLDNGRWKVQKIRAVQ